MGKLGERINIGELDTHMAPGSAAGKSAAALQFDPKYPQYAQIHIQNQKNKDREGKHFLNHFMFTLLVCLQIIFTIPSRDKCFENLPLGKMLTSLV